MTKGYIMSQETRVLLLTAFNEYKTACYGRDAVLTSTQEAEVRQAFFSGIHWLNSRWFIANTVTDPASVWNSVKGLEALRELTGVDRPRNLP